MGESTPDNRVNGCASTEYRASAASGPAWGSRPRMASSARSTCCAANRFDASRPMTAGNVWAARGGVGTGGLAHGFSGGGDVEHVVSDLKGEADRVAVRLRGSERVGRTAACDGPHAARATNERAGLQAVQLEQVRLFSGAIFGDVEHPGRPPCLPRPRLTPAQRRGDREVLVRQEAPTATSVKASVSSASPERIAIASPNTLWFVGRPRRRSSSSIAGRSS